ncbi:MAG: MBL fold metallo-hydrolase, partial [Novosphingobium sp.]|nr:MBL fold metallo-hydrolase [Novosphingobium sp.]
MNPQVQTFFDPATFTATHLVVDSATSQAAIIDPVLDFDAKSGKLATRSADALLEAVEDQGLTLHYVLETHAHADHLSAGDHLRRRSGADLAIGAGIAQVQRVFAPMFDA